MARYDFIVGVDPDVEKSGFALLNVKERRVNIDSLPFPQLIATFVAFKNRLEMLNARGVIVVEASWIAQANWHLSDVERKKIAASKGYDVGRNHQTGKLICEMARNLGFEVVEHIPLRKCWKGKDRKITHAEIAQFVPGLPPRTNQEERDAALLAWSFADLPIRLKVE